MCECGCGDFRGDFRFPGPDGSWYVLDVYDSCNECETPAGVVIYKMTEKELGEWGADDLPVLAPEFVGLAVPVVDPHKLSRTLAADGGIDEFEIQDAMREHFRDHVVAVFNAWKTEAMKHAATK